jgi:hypothetical protein
MAQDSERGEAVRARVEKVMADAGAPQSMRDLAVTIGPSADQAIARAEANYAEPDDLYVARLRGQHEASMRVSGPIEAYDYRYPEHLTGPGAANCPPPPQPEAGGEEAEPGA